MKPRIGAPSKYSYNSNKKIHQNEQLSIKMSIMYKIRICRNKAKPSLLEFADTLELIHLKTIQ